MGYMLNFDKSPHLGNVKLVWNGPHAGMLIIAPTCIAKSISSDPMVCIYQVSLKSEGVPIFLLEFIWNVPYWNRLKGAHLTWWSKSC